MQDLESMLAGYASAPEQLAATVRELSDADCDAVPIAGKWSIRQVICHLADFEVVYADRMKRVLVDDNPTMSGGDPDAFNAALQYQHRSMAEELELIASVRRSTGRILRNCDIEAFQRTGVHSAEGPMTLETLIERITGHIPHHLKFIHDKLAVLERA